MLVKINDQKIIISSDNCHSHVAKALSNMKYKGKNNYTMFSVWLMLCCKSKYNK